MRFRDLFLKRRRQPRAAVVPDFYPGYDAPTAALRYPLLPAPVTAATSPTAVYEPHGIDTPETLAAIWAKAQADGEVAQESAMAWQAADPIASLPVTPMPEAPPMPPSELSRAMVSQIPDPPANDRNFSWAHQYADYMRRVAVATGTSTNLEHTTAWSVPALQPGDGTGVRL